MNWTKRSLFLRRRGESDISAHKDTDARFLELGLTRSFVMLLPINVEIVCKQNRVGVSLNEKIKRIRNHSYQRPQRSEE